MATIAALYQKIDSVYFFSTHRDIQFFKIISDTLGKYHPGAKHVIALERDAKKMINSYNKYRLLSSVDAVESSIPNIRLPNLNGDTISLSSLKGKLTLISFWASWNKESVKYNLELKPLYEKYRDKGFEIYQVSLDNKKEIWERAVNFDEIPWINVSDLNSINSVAAKIYNVQNVPANYLIDKTQTDILGKNVTIRELKIKLNHLLN
jgi:thiol-disulfide isomerase/thioredoxin